MYDLVSVVGHVNDTTLDGSDDNNDNLVAHIRVGPSYHLRKEVIHHYCKHSLISSTVQSKVFVARIISRQDFHI